MFNFPNPELIVSMIERKLYTSQAKSIGGRDGGVSTSNGAFQLPVDMENKDSGTNPEQLFAAAIAVSFESALKLTANRRNIKLKKTSVNGFVDFGVTYLKKYEIAVRLEVLIPEVCTKTARILTEGAKDNCPYSQAVKNNISFQVI